MPKKKRAMSPAEQSEHFQREAQKLIDAGELNPTDAAAKMGDALQRRAKLRS